MRRTLTDYFTAGTRLVWLIDPEERGVEARASGAATVRADEAGTLDGGEILPGFALAAVDVFAGVPPGAAAEVPPRPRRSGRRA